MKVYDSNLREKVELVPLDSNEIRIYVCGPTVYDEAHLGHARSAISFDLLARFLEMRGYRVIIAKNFTDIDDKLINKSKQSNTPLNELAQKYIESYLRDMGCLNVRRAHFEPRATQYLESMIDFIQELLKKDIAYKLPNGDICLEVAKDCYYGSLSKHFDNKDSINRIEFEEGKKDQRDFVLWKAYKGEHDIGYESVLGRGRPGWHIECSAMIDSVLSYKDKEFCIDIHAGGQDLFFPHHENEASQTRCLRNKEIAKYWMHNGFVNINGEKMSKSLGNSFFIKDALKIYHGEILRNYLIGTHYHSPLNFNEEDLLSSKKRLDKIYRLKKRIGYEKIIIPDNIPQNSFEKLPKHDETFFYSYRKSLLQKVESSFCNNLFNALDDDLNISLALSIIEEFLKNANEYLDINPKDKAYKEKVRSNIELIDYILGLGTLSYVEYFQLGISNEEKDKIESLIQQRLEAKKQKDFNKADSIRNKLENMGISLMDKSQNITEWEKT